MRGGVFHVAIAIGGIAAVAFCVKQAIIAPTRRQRLLWAANAALFGLFTGWWIGFSLSLWVYADAPPTV